MRGLERVPRHAEQVVAYGVQVDGVPQPGGEGGHHGLGVVTGTVESAIDHPLHPAAQRVEQRRDDQRGGGYVHGPADRQHPGGQHDQPEVHAAEQRGDQRVGDHPADDAVQLV
jgi:hypothetical protein